MAVKSRALCIWLLPTILLTAGIALFWTYCWWSFGSVPTISAIKLHDKLVIQLPFSLSRWWDTALIPILAFASWLLFQVALKHKEDMGIRRYTYGIFCGLIFGLMIALISDNQGNLGLGLLISSAICLTFCLLYGTIFGLAMGISFCLIYGLLLGLPAALAVALALPLAVALAWAIVFGFIRKSKPKPVRRKRVRQSPA